MRGSPSTLAPVPVATTLAVDDAVTWWATRSRARQSAAVGRAEREPAGARAGPQSVAAPLLSRSPDSANPALRCRDAETRPRPALLLGGIRRGRRGSGLPKRNANSASATFMMLPAIGKAGTAREFCTTRLASSGAAKRPVDVDVFLAGHARGRDLPADNRLAGHARDFGLHA